ncbi:MAG TPA: electron transport complex subunit E [Fibrobacteraceae bacterium]|nr:electron transport complex subunit E [Fibrobacteraceae bacterium]
MQHRSSDVFLAGLWKENPVFVHLLGMCPTLAVTNSVHNALGMGVATACVLIASSLIVSLLRKWIPHQIRIAAYVTIVATFVTVADYLIQALSIELHKALGAFISLIVVNCIILGRAEAFASKNQPGLSFLDALGSGLGFTFALTCMGALREALGNGTLLGHPIFGPHFQPWVVMAMPGGGFFTLGILLLLVNVINEQIKRSRSAREGT